MRGSAICAFLRPQAAGSGPERDNTINPSNVRDMVEFAPFDLSQVSEHVAPTS
jgi:hypothetical protein